MNRDIELISGEGTVRVLSTPIILSVVFALLLAPASVLGQSNLGTRFLFVDGNRYVVYEPNHPDVTFDRLVPVCATKPTLFRVESSDPFPVMTLKSAFSLSCFNFQLRTISPTSSCPLEPTNYRLTFNAADESSGEVFAANESFANLTGGGSVMQSLFSYNATARPDVVYNVMFSQVSGKRCPAYLLVSGDVSLLSSAEEDVPFLLSAPTAIVTLDQSQGIELSFAHWSQDALVNTKALVVSRASTCSEVNSTWPNATITRLSDQTAANTSRWRISPHCAEPYILCFGSKEVGLLRVVGGSPAYYSASSTNGWQFTLTFFGADLDPAADDARVIPATGGNTCDNVTSRFSAFDVVQTGLTRSLRGTSATQMDASFFGRNLPGVLVCYKAAGAAWRAVENLLLFDEATAAWLRANATTPTTAAPSTAAPPLATLRPPGVTSAPTRLTPSPSRVCPTIPLSLITSFTGLSLQLVVAERTSVASLLRWLADYLCLRESSLVIMSQLSRNGVTTLTITVVCGNDPGCSSPQAELAIMFHTWKSQSSVFQSNGVTDVVVTTDNVSTEKDSNGLDLFFTIFSLICVAAIIVFCCVCCYCWCRRRRAQISTGGPQTVERVDSSDFDNEDSTIVQARIAGQADADAAVVGTVLNPVPPPVPTFVQAGGGYYYTEPPDNPGAPQRRSAPAVENALAHELDGNDDEELAEMQSSKKRL